MRVANHCAPLDISADAPLRLSEREAMSKESPQGKWELSEQRDIVEGFSQAR